MNTVVAELLQWLVFYWDNGNRAKWYGYRCSTISTEIEVETEGWEFVLSDLSAPKPDQRGNSRIKVIRVQFSHFEK